VSTRLQQRANKLQQVQTSLITNATLRAGAFKSTNMTKTGEHFSRGMLQQNFVVSPLSAQAGKRTHQYATMG